MKVWLRRHAAYWYGSVDAEYEAAGTGRFGAGGSGAGCKAGTARRDALGRHRLDRIKHRRSVAPGSRALSGRGRHRASQRRSACQIGARSWRALCRHRRSGLSTTTSRAELSGSGIEAGAGAEAVVEAAHRPADWVMAAITGATSLRPTLAAAERGAHVALANKECLVCAGALFMRRAAAAGATVLAGRFRAQRHFPGAGRRPARGRTPNRADRLRRAVPHLVDRRHPQGDGRAGAQASDLDDGPEDHDQFGNPDEQGSRVDRGPSPVRAGAGGARRRGPSRNRSFTAWSSSATARSSPSLARRICAFRSRIVWPGRCAWGRRRRGSISPASPRSRLKSPT